MPLMEILIEINWSKDGIVSTNFTSVRKIGCKSFLENG